MFVELHLLQNFSPSCLNRDDTNTPKDAEFGGHRRARISSQCIKRALRLYFASAELLPRDRLAERTKRLVGEVAGRLAERGRPAGEAAQLTKTTLASLRVTAREGHETEYLLFLGRREIDALAGVVDDHWDALSASLTPPPEEPEAGNRKGRAKTARQKKAEARDAVPAEVARQVKAVLDGGKAADIALFGRMLADQADLNIDAACQVAHALSTNKANMEIDFYTAVDDLKEREGAGAGMLGTVEFNSSCFYRYANVHFDQLVKNLQDDADLARQTVRAFLRACVEAVPTGKQNSMAAHNPPSLVFAVVRDRGLWSLANAFERPVRPDGAGSLVQNSVRALDAFWGRLTRMYGTEGLRTARVCVDDDSVALQALAGLRVGSVAEVMAEVLRDLPGGQGGA
jgi:CRISPR system Cascade subunit CasC